MKKRSYIIPFLLGVITYFVFREQINYFIDLILQYLLWVLQDMELSHLISKE